uniref:Uncharacterized protein n=1 Tax=Meloidogyne javanica TaxID=6303 RepID=A0A915MIL0_MELJA
MPLCLVLSYLKEKGSINDCWQSYEGISWTGLGACTCPGNNSDCHWIRLQTTYNKCIFELNNDASWHVQLNSLAQYSANRRGSSHAPISTSNPLTSMRVLATPSYEKVETKIENESENKRRQMIANEARLARIHAQEQRKIQLKEEQEIEKRRREQFKKDNEGVNSDNHGNNQNYKKNIQELRQRPTPSSQQLNQEATIKFRNVVLKDEKPRKNLAKTRPINPNNGINRKEKLNTENNFNEQEEQQNKVSEQNNHQQNKHQNKFEKLNEYKNMSEKLNESELQNKLDKNIELQIKCPQTFDDENNKNNCLLKKRAPQCSAALSRFVRFVSAPLVEAMFFCNPSTINEGMEEKMLPSVLQLNTKKCSSTNSNEQKQLQTRWSCTQTAKMCKAQPRCNYYLDKKEENETNNNIDKVEFIKKRKRPIGRKILGNKNGYNNTEQIDVNEFQTPKITNEGRGCRTRNIDGEWVEHYTDSIFRQYHDWSGRCSSWCECVVKGKEAGKAENASSHSIRCHSLGCLQDLQCETKHTTTVFGQRLYLENRGACQCHNGQFICDSSELQPELQPGIYLSLGYSQAEIDIIREKVPKLVLERSGLISHSNSLIKDLATRLQFALERLLPSGLRCRFVVVEHFKSEQVVLMQIQWFGIDHSANQTQPKWQSGKMEKVKF